MKNLCKTCENNKEIFPVVLCPKNPYGDEICNTEVCDDYTDNRIPTLIIFTKTTTGVVHRFNILTNLQFNLLKTNLKAISIIAYGPLNNEQISMLNSLNSYLEKECAKLDGVKLFLSSKVKEWIDI